MSHAIRILLADDHAVVRAGIRQFLEYAGDMRVVAEADNGQMAQALIEAERPDVAVLDIQMPGASGIEVSQWLRIHHPEIGVLVLTAYDDDPYVIAVLQAGANGYVLKTAAPVELIQAVRDVYEGKSAIDPAITHKLLNYIAGRHQAGQTPKLALAEKLSDRELAVLGLAGKGYTNKAIGLQLGISGRTVQSHLARIYTKLEAGSRTEAVMRAVALGLIATGTAAPAGDY
jgi:DNA-binding NarL/FixJ family response regulator